ncbi:MAG: endonuclease III [Phycisphaerales bacterium]
MTPAPRKAADNEKAEFGFALPKTTAPQRARAEKLLAELRRFYPNAHCELVYTSPHELLVATILSAQATDASVNKATPALFKAFPTPADYANATPQQIEPYIKSIGLYRNKAKHIHAAMKDIVEKFGGQVPRTMDELLTLRGVARKTAGVVLGNAFNINMNVVVDTHVHRLSQRLALVPDGANVQQTERHLMALFPRDSWCELSHLLIFHGRYTCKARGVQCCQHPVCTDFGQRCELRVSAKPRLSEPEASAREADKALRVGQRSSRSGSLKRQSRQ